MHQIYEIWQPEILCPIKFVLFLILYSWSRVPYYSDWREKGQKAPQTTGSIWSDLKHQGPLQDPKNAWRPQPNCAWSSHENASGLKIGPSNQYQEEKQIGKEEAERQWKKNVVPLMEEDLARAETNTELEIGLDDVKRRWQTNIQVVTNYDFF